ncbi:diphthine--ammonia ligase [Psychrobacillus sp. INOP01]|uniref:Dph6-related ATP pyrophosphatase n=1 Tax=Psychrobacillus sp. INOP01 TaxID=2829187 RepID=UPI001BAD79D2|nr:diphthine--ammonia ligase [Psychrobacillus sp. INOP01]QUG40718.1 diphthine--ammonia ligase [Psychrobacillus sp. INOP01]
MRDIPFVCSWSGGKDSAMAYYRAMKMGMRPKKLLTMFEEEGEISKSHALPLEVVTAQAKHLGVPLSIKEASWNSYEGQFIEAMDECDAEGITHGVFGDIDLEGHLEWVQNTCAKSNIVAVHPLWKEPRLKIIEELLDVGFEAWIVVVNTTMMPAEFIGRKFSKELIVELEALEIDACGENGEFHTVVVDGPIFSKRVPVKIGHAIVRGDYVFSPVSIA